MFLSDPRCAGKIIFNRHVLQYVKKCSNGIHSSLFQLQLQTDFQQSYPAVSISLWQEFQIFISAASLYAVAGKIYLCGVKPVAHSV
jgi:hypothetical protein